MLIVSLLLSLMLPTNLASDEILLDLLYLSELGTMKILPPSNKTNYNNNYYAFAHGQYLLSIRFHNDDRKLRIDQSVFVTMSSDQAINYFDGVIEYEKSHPETEEEPIVNYVVKNGYIYWSRNSDNLKLVTEFRSDTDYSKYEEYLTDLYDQIKSRQYESISIISNLLPAIDTKGTSLNHMGQNNPVILLHANLKQGQDELIETVSVFLNSEDAKISYDYLSKFLPEQYRENIKHSSIFEDIEISGNIVSYRVRTPAVRRRIQ